MRRRQQALDHLTILKVRLNNFVNVMLINVAVPNRLRVHHQHRTRSTTVQTTGLVNAYLPGTAQAGVFDARLAMIKRGLRPVMRAGVLAVTALIEAKENMALVIRCRRCTAI